jgi:hypothetical protein
MQFFAPIFRPMIKKSIQQPYIRHSKRHQFHLQLLSFSLIISSSQLFANFVQFCKFVNSKFNFNFNYFIIESITRYTDVDVMLCCWLLVVVVGGCCCLLILMFGIVLPFWDFGNFEIFNDFWRIEQVVKA